ncbi:hypothetical protein BTA51_19905 [Hahella sp. CCB-MM4]|nr:hypothetical protein BTA51_19905 [Hahella sp. CCB-MM4]
MIRRPAHPSLRPFVKELWALDHCDPVQCQSGEREHVLPTGNMHLAFRLSSSPLKTFSDSQDLEGRTLSLSVLGGIRSRYYIRDISAPSCSVGVVLQPGTASLLFGTPAEELSERHTSVEALWGRESVLVREQLLEASGAEQQLNRMEAILCSRLPATNGLHPVVADALVRFQAMESVESVVEYTGYSHRHFISLFRQALGITPKVYCRILRFQSLMKLLSENIQYPMADLAQIAGFSDQAHFSRSFKEMSGLTPSKFREIAPPSSHHVKLPPSSQT